MQAKLLLVLHRRRCGNRLEVMVQRGDTHPDAFGQFPDIQLLREIFSKPADGLSDLVTWGLADRNLYQARTE